MPRFTSVAAAFLPGEQQPRFAFPQQFTLAIYPEFSGQNLSQTFTPSEDQWLGYLQLPVGCAAGVLLNVKIRDGLGGAILYEANHAGLPQTVDTVFQLLQVYNPAVTPLGIPLQAHHTYAFELAAFPGPAATELTCGLAHGPATDSYAGGRGFYRDPINGTGWFPLPNGAPTDDQDLPFITLVTPRTPSAPAVVPGSLSGLLWFRYAQKNWKLGVEASVDALGSRGRITFQDGAQTSLWVVAEKVDWIRISATKTVFQAQGFYRGRPGTVTILGVLRDGGSGIANAARVRVTDSSGAIVFDNQPGQPADSDWVTPRLEGTLAIRR